SGRLYSVHHQVAVVLRYRRHNLCSSRDRLFRSSGVVASRRHSHLQIEKLERSSNGGF
ncbi:unnamed protein product, partial [Brassica rapa]